MKRFLVVLVGWLLTATMVSADWPGVVTLDSGATMSFHKPLISGVPIYSHIQWGDKGDWYIRSSATDGLVVLQDSGGHVGIGTSAVGYDERLNVNGKVRVDGDLIFVGTLYVDGDTQITKGLTVNGTASIGDMPFVAGAANPLCTTAGAGAGQIKLCQSSSRAYKNNIEDMKQGLEAVSKLRPVTFTWKKTGEADLGFIAEEVAEVAPLLTMYNKEGAPEGVKYPYVTTVLVKAVQEQQAMLQEKEQRIQKLEKALELLTKKVAALDAPGRIAENR